MERHGLKAADLASLEDPGNLSRILNGNRQISKTLAKKLAERFGVSAAVFCKPWSWFAIPRIPRYNLPMHLKGSLPALILETLSRGRNHGYGIAQRIKGLSEGVLDFKEGTLYPALHGLEREGLIESYSQDENGRTRRYYRLTDAGHKALVSKRAEWRRYARAVEQVLGGV
jgi:transcriptional regulator